MNTVIEKMSHDGRGISRINGQTTFIDGALTGEVVTFSYLKKKRDFAEGRLESVIVPSQHRVTPKCPHAEICGGCSLQHLDPLVQIQEKERWLLELLERVGKITPEHVLTPLASDGWHYRNKARLSVRHVVKKQKTLVGFRERHQPRYIAEIHTCPILNQRVDAALPRMGALLDAFESPSTVAQIEVAAGDDVVALIVRNLSPLSHHDADLLRQFAIDEAFHVFLQPKGPDSVVRFYPMSEDDFLNYALPDFGLNFKFHPTDFTQVNAGINRQMVRQAIDLLAPSKEDVVMDLFCGLGNFSLPLATLAQSVMGVEGSPAMVTRATMNAKRNGIDNASFYCANLDDPKALSTLPKRLVHKVLLDPPRTGALVLVEQIATIKPQSIVYVSCNPITLARDAAILVHEQGYRLKNAGIMDMFPHTAHVESMALFELR